MQFIGATPTFVADELDEFPYVEIVDCRAKEEFNNEDPPLPASVSFVVDSFGAMRSVIELLEFIREDSADKFDIEVQITYARTVVGCCDFNVYPESVGLSIVFGTMDTRTITFSDRDFAEIAQLIKKWRTGL